MSTQLKPTVRISWVIPLFQDESHLELIVEKSAAFLNALGASYEMILINDGSTDGTADLAATLKKRWSFLRVIHHPENRGYGAALATGFAAAAATDFIGYTDGDAQYDPLDFIEACRGALAHGRTAVLGYKTTRSEGKLRALQSNIYNRMVRTAFGLAVRDINCSLKFFPAAAIQKRPLVSRSAFIDAELLLHLQAAKIDFVQTPVRHFARGGGTTEATSHGFGARPSVIARTFKDLIFYRLHHASSAL